MKYAIPAALALGLFAASGLAQAQTSGTSTMANPAAGTAATTTTNNSSSTAASAPTTGNGVLGTNVTGRPNGASNAAVSTSSAPNRNAPVAGANSFTEGEARKRIQDKGFGQVTGLKLDGQGVWRGTATKDGKTANVALDYQGNVVSQ